MAAIEIANQKAKDAGELDKDFDVKISIDGDSCTDNSPADPD